MVKPDAAEVNPAKPDTIKPDVVTPTSPDRAHAPAPVISPGQVFLVSAGLPQRWRGRERFVVLDTDFAAGHTFLATWQAWRDDACSPGRCGQLVFVSIDPKLLTRLQLQAALVGSPTPGLADALVAAWPPNTPDLHSLRFESGQVELLLLSGTTVPDGLRKLVAAVDAFRHVIAPKAGRPDQAGRIAKALGRLAAPGATLSMGDIGAAGAAAWVSAGFALQAPARNAKGTGHVFSDVAADVAADAVADVIADVVADKFGVPGSANAPPDATTETTTAAHFAPRFDTRPRSTREPRPSTERHVLIVGAGLAGCAAAWALAERGWRSTVFERHDQPATGASGNPAGLFHSVVHEPDSRHARFNRAAALEATSAVRAAIHRGVAGATNGLLRLEQALDQAQMRGVLNRLGLPPDHVEALSAAEASARAGMALSLPCWFFARGGWVQPAGLARSFLDRAGDQVEFRPGNDVQALEQTESGWRLLDAGVGLVGESATVVLANACGAFRLIDSHQPQPGVTEQVRGQISTADASMLTAPRVPISGSGYLLPATQGRIMFGATAQRDDADASVRSIDHRLNLDRLARLTGRPESAGASGPTTLSLDQLEGRTAFRCSAIDRLPLIGAVADRSACVRTRGEQPRFVPRLPGLYLFSALGSRGITWSALGARVLASWISGAPMPLEADLVDAIDPARFVSRQWRRSHRA